MARRVLVLEVDDGELFDQLHNPQGSHPGGNAFCEMIGRRVVEALLGGLSDMDKVKLLAVHGIKAEDNAQVKHWEDQIAELNEANEIYKNAGNELLPYKEELLRIASFVGEPDDPFAAWEGLHRSLTGSEVEAGLDELRPFLDYDRLASRLNAKTAMVGNS